MHKLECHGGFFMRAGTTDLSIWQYVHDQNCYRLPARLPDGCTVVDVGGHIGSFSRLCQERGAGRVIAAEPCRESADLFVKNVPGAELKRFAVVGHGLGKAKLAHMDGNPCTYTLLLENDDSEEVPLITLNDLCKSLDHIHLLKLDCEGGEYDILAHSDAVLARCEAVIVECHTGLGKGPAGVEEIAQAIQRAGLEIRQRFDLGGPHLLAARPGTSWWSKRPYELLIGVPSTGWISEGTANASFLASKRHKVHRRPSCASGGNFNELWAAALTAGAAGSITHYAQLHADIEVIESESGLLWADRQIEEMDAVDADFLSSPLAIKDIRKLTSCGIGNPANPWKPWRRFTTKELDSFPRTFDAAQVGYATRYLLHNFALCIWDMRKPVWYQTDEDGETPFVFNFREKIKRVGDVWERSQDSEDWAYSRIMWQRGVKSFLTTRIEVIHLGELGWSNKGSEGGIYQNGDEDLASQWRSEIKPPPKPARNLRSGLALTGSLGAP